MSRRSEICKNCCPDGGAIFKPTIIYDEAIDSLRTVKECQNCGATKEFKKATAKVQARRDAREKLMQELSASIEHGEPPTCPPHP